MKKALFFILCLCFANNICFALINPADYRRAIKYLEEEKYNEAIEILQNSLKEDPDQATIYNLLGLIYLRQNESITSAIGSLEQAIRVDPNFAEAYFNLASVYAGAGNRPDLAAEYFKKTLEVDPKYVKAYFGLGWFTLTAKEDPGKAIEYFQKAISSFPEFAEAYYGLGLAYVQFRKAPMALESISQLRAMGREDLATYLEMAVRGEGLSESFRAENSELSNVEGEVPPSQFPEEPAHQKILSGVTRKPSADKKTSEIPTRSESPSADQSNPFSLT